MNWLKKWLEPKDDGNELVSIKPLITLSIIGTFVSVGICALFVILIG